MKYSPAYIFLPLFIENPLETVPVISLSPTTYENILLFLFCSTKLSICNTYNIDTLAEEAGRKKFQKQLINPTKLSS